MTFDGYCYFLKEYMLYKLRHANVIIGKGQHKVGFEYQLLAPHFKNRPFGNLFPLTMYGNMAPDMHRIFAILRKGNLLQVENPAVEKGIRILLRFEVIILKTICGGFVN